MRLVLDQVGCVRGGRTVLRGVGARVPAGSALIVTGPNGAGKSTLLRAVAGLLASTGEIRLEGGDSERSVGEQAHFVGHLDAVKPSFGVGENLSFWRDLLGGAGEIDAALEAVGLAELAHLPASVLSAGQRRRLALARLLVAERSLWLLDEPTTALDSASQARLASIIEAHLADGGIVVAATHSDLGLARAATLALEPAR